MDNYKKKYKEALERAKKELDTCGSQDCDAARQIFRFFPELKESEDEKMRKTLVELVKCNERCGYFMINNITTSAMLAWLEKQDNANKEYWRGYREGKKEILDKYSELEKQGEQKSTLPKWKYKKDNTTLLKDSLVLNKCGHMAKLSSGAIVSDVWVLDYDELAKLPKEELEEQGEQKPRYSIGDVLCDKSCTTLNKDVQPNFEITDIRNGMYICDKCSFPISQQDEYELVAKRIEQKPTFEMKTPEESLGISSEEYKKIVDTCLYSDKIESKLSWTEDDKRILDALITSLINERFAGRLEFLKGIKVSSVIDWLKSLKEKRQ